MDPSAPPTASVGSDSASALADRLFPADTETGRLCRGIDWSHTPLGPLAQWPESLRCAVGMVLRQGIPQSLCWGPDLRQIYNDAYRAIMGDKHPAGLGRPVFENWAEVEADVGPLFTRVLAGETVYFEDLPLQVYRNGGFQEACFTFSYSPVLTETGAVGGALINCFETTHQVAGRRAQAERDQLLAALQIERSRLEGVFRQSPSFLAILRGPDDVFEMVNPAYERFIGEGRDVVGRPLFEALPEVRDQGFEKTHRHVRESGESVVIQGLRVMIGRTLGGPLEERFMDVTYLPLREADGSNDAVIAHGSDVTDHVRARRATEEANARLQDQALELELTNQQLQDNAVELEQQAEELQSTAAHLEERGEEAEAARRTVAAIVEAVTDGFIAFDRDLRFTYVNRRAAELWGRPVSELLGRTPAEVFPGMDRSPFFAMVERVARTGRADVIEDYATSLHIPIELRAYPLADGGAVGFFTDLSERRRAEAAATFMVEASRTLASSADYQSTLTNLAAAAVPRLGDWCAVDVLAEPDSAAWPPKIERVATIHQDPAMRELARAMNAAFPPDWSRDAGTVGVLRTRQPVLVSEITEAMRAASARNEAHLAMMRQLDIRSIIVVPLVARDRVLGTITLVMSESGRRFTEADLTLAIDLGQRAGVALDNARLLRDANAANVAKTEFLRTVSHELRQPLNAIQGYLGLWKLGIRGELPSTMREDIERLSRNQEHLAVLIEDLLSFTRLEAGQLSIERAPVSTASVVASLEAMMRPQMHEHRIEFDCAPGDASLAVLGDQHRIVQICVNLLTNAMRATPPHGRVTLRCAPDDGSIVITVTDTGSGIAEEQLESIFSPFTQLGRTLNAPREGAGLGLAISRGLAEAMGGSLQVTSELGKGSMFSLRLPRAVG